MAVMVVPLPADITPKLSTANNFSSYSVLNVITFSKNIQTDIFNRRHTHIHISYFNRSYTYIHTYTDPIGDVCVGDIAVWTVWCGVEVVVVVVVSWRHSHITCKHKRNKLVMVVMVIKIEDETTRNDVKKVEIRKMEYKSKNTVR